MKKKKLMTLCDSVEYMSQERMMQHIVKMLARKLPKPIKETECDVSVRFA